MPVDHERDGAVLARGAGDTGEEEPIIAPDAERDEVLFPGEVVRVAVPDHGAPGIRSGAGCRLGEGEGHPDIAGNLWKDEFLALLVGCELVDGPPNAVDDMHNHPERGVGHREELDELEVFGELQSPSAVLLGRRKPKVTAVPKFRPEALRHPVLGFDLFGVPLPRSADELLDLPPKRLEFLVVVHGHSLSVSQGSRVALAAQNVRDPLAEFELLDFTARVAWQFIDDLQPLRPVLLGDMTF